MSEKPTTRFKVRDTYTFGILKQSSDPLYPEFRESRSKKGKYFHDLNVPTLEEYLTQNPDRWSHKNVIYFYTTNPDGSYKYFGQMTPPAPTMQTGVPGLADGAVPGTGPRHTEDVQHGAFLMERIESLERWLRDKDDELRMAYSENVRLERELAAAQEENKKMVEMRRFRDEVEEAALKQIDKQQKQSGGGLGDPMQLIGLFMNLLNQNSQGNTQAGFQGLSGMSPTPQMTAPAMMPQPAPQHYPTQGGMVNGGAGPAQTTAPAMMPRPVIEYAKNVQEG